MNKSVLTMKIEDIHALVRWFDSNSAVDDLTLGQLVEIKRSAPEGCPDINAWFTADYENALAEFHRVLAGEPHRRGLKLKITRDPDPGDPRTEYTDSNVGTMVCWHKRYALGDGKTPKLDPEEYCSTEIPEGSIVLNLFLYDHSGLRMGTNAFQCRWDSGQVGYIYATPERIVKFFGEYETMTDELRAVVVQVLEAEVKLYDDYLSGNVWGFVLENEDGEDLDSCGGFYGDDKDGIAYHLGDDAKALLDEAWENRS